MLLQLSFLLGLSFVISTVVPIPSTYQLHKRTLHHEPNLSYVNEKAHRHPRDVIISILLQRWMEHLEPNNISNPTKYPLRLRRVLGDFDELNDLFEGTVIALPDFFIPVRKIAGSMVNIWATDIECKGIQVDDIIVNYNKISNTQLDFSLKVENLDIICDLEWRYKWWIFNGEGSMNVKSFDNDASTTITFNSKDFDVHPPYGSSVSDCVPAISIDVLTFKGGVVNRILNLFKEAISNQVEKEINGVVCEELGSLGTGLVDDMLQYLENFLESYLGSTTAAYDDALVAESFLTVPPNVQLMDLFSSESKVGGFVQGTLRNLDQMFGTQVLDPLSPTGTGKDLGINKFVRSTMLDENRSYILDVSDWPESISNNGIIFKGHDILTETVIELTQVKIIGLDSFTSFDPLNNIGNHTVSNHLFLDYLTIQMNLVINIKPSTKSDSVIAVGSTAEINEEIQINFGVKEIDIDLFLLLAIEEDKVGNIEIGSIVNGTNIFNCIVDSLFVTELTGLSLSVGDISLPTLEGFVSPGIDRLVTKAVDAAFIMYEASFLKALPNLFQTLVRELFNKALSNMLTPSDGCLPTPSSLLRHGFVNFPDLLLPPEKAVEVGGTGSSSYGIFFRQAMDIVLERFTINPLDGTSDINDMLISPFTKNQSGVEGTVLLPRISFDINDWVKLDRLKEKFALIISKAKIENLNTFGAPLDLLEPIAPTVLNNTIGIGIGPKPLRGSMHILFEYDNSDNIQVSNLLEVGLEFNHTTINLEALVALSQSNFLQFPVRSMSNLNCWLSLISAPHLSSDNLLSEASNKTLALEELGIFPSSMRLTADCVFCSSTEFELFSELLKSPEIEQEVTDMATQLFDYISGKDGAEFLQVEIDRILSDAHEDYDCPHNARNIMKQDLHVAHEDFDPTLEFNFSNIQCSEIKVDDVRIGYNQVDNATLDFDLAVDGFDIQCQIDWNYTFWLFHGSGQADLGSSNSSASTTITFTSDDFNFHPPRSSSISQCKIKLGLGDANVQGGLLGGILDIFLHGSTKDVVENVINELACDQLIPLGTLAIADMLQYTNNMFQPYLNDTSTAFADAQDAETNLVIPSDVQLLDLFTGNMFQSVQWIVDEVIGMVPDPYSSTQSGEDLAINKFLRSILLNENRSFVLDTSDQSDFITINGLIFEGQIMSMEIRVEVTQVKIYGMDTFTDIDLLNSFGNHTILNQLRMDYLKVELDLTVSVKPQRHSESFIMTEINEEIQINFGLEEINLDLYLLTAIEEFKLGNMELGTIMNSTKALDCLFASLFVTEITGLSVKVANIFPPTVNGFISPMIDGALNSAIDTVFEMYKSEFLLILPNLFQTTVRDFINEMFSELVSTSEACPQISQPVFDTYVNIPDLLLPSEEAMKVGGTGMEPYGSIIPQAANFFLNQLDIVSAANDLLISPITESQSGIPGTLLFGNLFKVIKQLSIDKFRANLFLEASEAKLENIDSVGLPIDLLEPIASIVMNNTMRVGVTPKPLRGSIRFQFKMDSDYITFNNVVNIGMELDDATINMVALIALSEASLMQLTVENMSNLNCWLSLIPAPQLDSKGVRTENSKLTLALETLRIALSSVRLTIDCVSCTSPDFELLAELLSSTENRDDVTEMMSGLLDYLSKQLGGEFLQVQLDRMLAKGEVLCPRNFSGLTSETSEVSYEAFDPPKQPGDNMTILVATALGLGFLFLCVFSINLLIWCVRRRRHSNWLKTLSVNAIKVLYDKEESVKERQRKLNGNTTSMVTSTSIPLLMRVFIPVVILGNIALFLVGHLSLGASVNVRILLAGQAFDIKQFFTFSMAESILDMWEAGAKELAILVIIFSGIWPYLKQLTTLCLWLLPPTWVSVSRRGSIFLWLDALGKWSFIDIFVLIMSVVSFRVSVASPDISFIPKDVYAIDLMVVPQRGLYSNMLAQLVSQISSHFIIFYHRRIISFFDQEEEENDQTECILQDTEEESVETIALCKHVFDREGAKKGKTMILHPIVNTIVLLFAFVIVVLIICGCILPSFALDVVGLLGLAVESGQNFQNAFNLHSIFSIVRLMFEQASFLDKTSDYLGLGALAIVLIFTVLIVPLLQVLLLMRRWFLPLTKQARHRNFVAIEALQAWQYVEVYILAVVVSSWQLGAVSQFMINDYCGGLEDTFASLVYYGFVKESDAQCFRVNAHVIEGVWILFTASCMLTVCNHFVTRASSQQEKDEREALSIIPTDSSLTGAKLYDDVEYITDTQSLRLTSPLFTDFYRWCLRSDQSTDDFKTEIGGYYS